jgi:hypothetical protein
MASNGNGGGGGGGADNSDEGFVVTVEYDFKR